MLNYKSFCRKIGIKELRGSPKVLKKLIRYLMAANRVILFEINISKEDAT